MMSLPVTVNQVMFPSLHNAWAADTRGRQKQHSRRCARLWSSHWERSSFTVQEFRLDFFPLSFHTRNTAALTHKAQCEGGRRRRGREDGFGGTSQQHFRTEWSSQEPGHWRLVLGGSWSWSEDKQEEWKINKCRPESLTEGSNWF